MTNDKILNKNEIKKTLAMLKPDGRLFEIRVFGGNNKKNIISGYFKSVDEMMKAFDTIDCRNRNIYITLNSIKEECFYRAQSNKFLSGQQTTSDNDIEGYEWLFVDVDPQRASGISSSNEEFEKAKEMAHKVYEYLKGLGFEEPVKAISGNGCHLLYKISLANTEDNKKLVKACLQSLSSTFDTDDVKIDTSNFNPARICKLHGTLAQKGVSSDARPHRMSYIFSDSMEIKLNDKVFLEKLADEVPRQAEQEQHKQWSHQQRANEFNLEEFLSQHGLTYTEGETDTAIMYKLDTCPFDASHTDGDARIFKYDNGAIAFKCHHNSCQGKKWQDVRMLYEPDAYERNSADKRIDEGWAQHNRDKQESITYRTLTAEDGKMFRNALEIISDQEPDVEYVKTGIDVIDSKMHGLEKKCVTVMSGLRASGKSTVLGQIMLNMIDDGQNVICYSGELSNKKYLTWLIRQAAGRLYIEQSAIHKNGYGVPQEVREKIIDWMGKRFWLYNNKFGNRFKDMEQNLVTFAKQYAADVLVLDNLMALNITDYNAQNKYEAQTAFVWKLKEIAEVTNTHIIFVAHPKKSQGFLRLDDISGSGNIGNIVDNAFIIHRNNHDFEKFFTQEFGKEKYLDVAPATNVIEIAKERESGIQDEFISLFYEEESKRLRNRIDESRNYSWLDDTFLDQEDINDYIPF